ncbi:serum response factor-binding protein 1 [Chanos chanos]|uniref:Serum response factor-binding protein 1 n=1 Tax=Chanos chanos TaxID=29144 RepID=A0A6J2WM71_CHACN|nr:serum response factor-binding protein 1 [Chanos chanos]XP_030644718.1 serum response factor-binding protein 1 [Chanos chanos]
MPAVLNLNNEVVKMRAEVKRVRTLVIRKLTRQIAALKKKKGSEADLQRNQRRVSRFLEEIHELKILSPDTVTKTALQKDISFEKVVQNKDASISERAVARIATHPQFSKKIQSLKDAVKAFKDERINTVETEKKGEKECGGSTEQQVELPKVSDGEGGEKVKEGTSVEKVSTERENIPEEVVRMRKPVKRLCILLIQKLTAQVAVLKEKKGKEPVEKENQAPVKRLQEEIQILRTIKPDCVTKTALDEAIDLVKVLQDPDASPLERVTARIATHPQFVSKLQNVKEAIGKERRKSGEAEQKREGEEEVSLQLKDEGNDEEVADEDDDSSETENEEGDEDDERGKEDEEQDSHHSEEMQKSSIAEQTKETNTVVKELSLIKEGTTQSEIKNQTALVTPVKQGNRPETALKVDGAEELLTNKKEAPAKKQVQEKTALQKREDDKPETKNPENKDRNLEEESDLESSGDEEEKEYFDDSTEERFRKQSSQSEESDEDDFFLGKVSKFKKKKKKSDSGPNEEKRGEVKKASKMEDEEEDEDTPQDFKPSKLKSVFCSSLSRTNSGPQKPQRGFSKGGPKASRFQNQKSHPDGDAKASWYKNRGPGPDKKPSPSTFHSQTYGPSSSGHRERGPVGAGRGRPTFERQQQHRVPPGKIPNPPHRPQQSQALHPSWEASRKRKEQQSQITAFQGKKIKFDDDDD